MGYITQTMKGRSRSIIVLNAPSSFAMIYKGASYFLDETTTRKVQVTSGASNDELTSIVHPEQLEEKFGGKAKNIEVYWPPCLQSTEFGVSSEMKAP